MHISLWDIDFLAFIPQVGLLDHMVVLFFEETWIQFDGGCDEQENANESIPLSTSGNVDQCWHIFLLIYLFFMQRDWISGLLCVICEFFNSQVEAHILTVFHGMAYKPIQGLSRYHRFPIHNPWVAHFRERKRLLCNQSLGEKSHQGMYNTLMWGADSGGGCVPGEVQWEVTYGHSVLLSQFCCNPKMAVKIKSV